MRISSDQNGSVENAYLGFEVRRGRAGEKDCGGVARELLGPVVLKH